MAGKEDLFEKLSAKEKAALNGASREEVELAIREHDLNTQFKDLIHSPKQYVPQVFNGKTVMSPVISAVASEKAGEVLKDLSEVSTRITELRIERHFYAED